ncbi:MAG: putative metal-sulfur cluster biosynthetic enzyme [Gammaproteobacteria bacterium]|jgi:FeS assembly SUF system protein|nr:putative metal-sulfur cluster biosynthetic enzyme [Gammaproteobacteria bacterium]
MNTQATSETTNISADALRQKVIAALRTVYDPEIPVNIYELGLIYRVEVDEDNNVSIDMTLTTPSCPEAQNLPASVEAAVQDVPEVKSVKVELVWDPPWDKDRMSEEVKMVLGIF